MKWILCAIWIALFILLGSACSKPEENGKKEDVVKTEEVVKQKDSDQKADANVDADTQVDSVSQVEVPAAYKWLEERTKTKNINPEGLPIFAFHEADFDLDGQKEAVVSFGNRSEWDVFPNFFVLQAKSKGSPEDVEIFKSSDYSSLSLDIVRLEGSDRPYIYVIHPGGNYNGISLYTFNGARIKPIFEYVTAGSADLYDKDGDGYMDGYSRGYVNYTTCYEELGIDYVWDGKQFQEQNMPYDAGPYPTDPKLLIQQYTKLLELGSWFPSTDIDRRLAELTDDKKVPTEAAMAISGCTALAIESTIKVIKEEGNRMSLLFSKDTYSGHIKLTFELQKKGKRWNIADIREHVPTPY